MNNRHGKRRNSEATESASGKSANPKVLFNRYIELAKSAAVQGQKIESENYYQHAEHFFRMMKLAKAEDQ